MAENESWMTKTQVFQKRGQLEALQWTPRASKVRSSFRLLTATGIVEELIAYNYSILTICIYGILLAVDTTATATATLFVSLKRNNSRKRFRSRMGDKFINLEKDLIDKKTYVPVHPRCDWSVWPLQAEFKERALPKIGWRTRVKGTPWSVGFTRRFLWTSTRSRFSVHFSRRMYFAHRKLVISIDQLAPRVSIVNNQFSNVKLDWFIWFTEATSLRLRFVACTQRSRHTKY